MPEPHPCLSCGACCASFRVDFSVYESEDSGGRVPRGLIEEVTNFTCRMRGTDYARPALRSADRHRGRESCLRHLRMAAVPLSRICGRL